MELKIKQEFKIKDPSYLYLRKSYLKRIVLGTSSTITISFIVSLANARLHKLPIKVFFNKIKEYSLLSLVFFAGNEVAWSFFNYHSLYTNYWLCYSLSSYICYNGYYKYLIKKQTLWYSAILHSQKINLLFLSYALLMESVLELLKETIIYNEPDILDKTKDFWDKDGKLVATGEDFQREVFNKSLVFLNSKKKRQEMKEFIERSPQKYKNLGIINMAAFIKEQSEKNK